MAHQYRISIHLIQCQSIKTVANPVDISNAMHRALFSNQQVNFILVLLVFFLLLLYFFYQPSFEQPEEIHKYYTASAPSGYYCQYHTTNHESESNTHVKTLTGSCYCGVDKYCMCTPSVAIDVLGMIALDRLNMSKMLPNFNQMKRQKAKIFTDVSIIVNPIAQDIKLGVVMVQRKHFPFGLALVGGFVDIGESVEDAVYREFFEETNTHLIQNSLRLVSVLSNPDDDPRRHSVSIVHSAFVENSSIATMQAKDDARELFVLPLRDLFATKKEYLFWSDFAVEVQTRMAFQSHWIALEKFLVYSS